MPKRNIMREFKLSEISAVDRPAQEHALALIAKRAPTPAVSALLKYYGPSPMSATGAQSFAVTLAEQQRFKDQEDVMSILGPAIYALESSLRSIAADPSLSAPARQAMMQVSTEQFLGVARTKWPEVDDELSKFLEGSENMTKTVAELEASVSDLTKQLAAAEAARKTAETDKTGVEAAKSALQTELSKAKADLAEAIVKASMSDEEKEADEKLKDDAKKAFRAASASDRAATIAKMRAEDESLTIGGATVRKSVVGPATFGILKAQSEAITKAEKAAADERELRKSAEFEKRADSELGSYAGLTAEKAAVLKAVSVLPEAEQKTLNTMLKAGAAAIEAAYTSIGHLGGKDVSKSAQAFQKRIEEVKAANPKMSSADVLSKTRLSFPDEFKAYQGSGN